jgi:hypothetical protein
LVINYTSQRKKKGCDEAGTSTMVAELLDDCREDEVRP